jgi:hypothetical protein
MLEGVYLQVPELSCPIAIPASFLSRRDLLEDEWEVLIKSSNLKIHASVQDLNTWVTKIRQSYVDSYLVILGPSLSTHFF